jgi:hypothetical protein
MTFKTVISFLFSEMNARTKIRKVERDNFNIGTFLEVSRILKKE